MLQYRSVGVELGENAVFYVSVTLLQGFSSYPVASDIFLLLSAVEL